MSLFGNLKEKTKNVEAAKDSLGGGGFGAKETDIYTGDVKVAYVGKADSGADWMQLIIENMKTSDGLDAGEFRAQGYFTSGNAKDELDEAAGVMKTFIPVKGSLKNNGLRSEERRVGKECRSRWSPYH